MADPPGMRVDELARRAGVATTTVRLYHSKGLLPPPRLHGRTGFYDDTHLTRLETIGRLQERGFSLAGIAALIESWERGGDLADLLGAERRLGGFLAPREPLVLTTEELVDAFPPGALDPASVPRAAALGLIELTPDGRMRVRDRRFLETGAALARLGVPTAAILDEWEHLVEVTDAVAERFAEVFERHLLPAGRPKELDAAEATRLAGVLDELRANAERVLLAAFDDSILRVATARFGELFEREGWTEGATPLPAIGAPATRALGNLGVTTLEQVSRHRRADLLALHGVGPKAVRTLEAAMRGAGLEFAPA